MIVARCWLVETVSANQKREPSGVRENGGGLTWSGTDDAGGSRDARNSP